MMLPAWFLCLLVAGEHSSKESAVLRAKEQRPPCRHGFRALSSLPPLSTRHGIGVVLFFPRRKMRAALPEAEIFCLHRKGDGRWHYGILLERQREEGEGRLQ